MSAKPVSRRNFLKTSAVAAAIPFLLSGRLRGADVSANERIAVGIIGVGKMGGLHLRRLLENESVQIVAVCDVDTVRREHHREAVNSHYAAQAGRQRYAGCSSYSDFRDLLARDDIDAVVIATPDHWHALIAIAAARAGKDIYCEKPLCQSIEEARAIVEAVRAENCVFQTGSQQRSTGPFREACELVRNGAIGEIRRITVALPPGLAVPCDLPESDPTAGLDWDLWLGPAPFRGWNEVLSPVGVHDHYPEWRHYREYGGGMITDWGAHHFDIVQWAMDQDESGPVEVIPPAVPGSSSGARFYYRNGVEVTHLEGNGITFFGTDGEIFVNRRTIEVKPATLEREAFLAEAKIRLPATGSHERNWIDCIRSRRKPVCHEEIGARSVTVCHLVNLAYWHNARFGWDPRANQFLTGSGNPDWLRVENGYRDPWKLA